MLGEQVQDGGVRVGRVYEPATGKRLIFMIVNESELS